MQQPLSNPASSTFKYPNYESIINGLQERIHLLKQEQNQLNQKYEKMRNSIEYARASDIKITNADQQEFGQEDDSHQVLRKIVQAAISDEHSNEFAVRETEIFQKQNLQTQTEINLKMQSIQQLDKDLQKTQIKQQEIICQLQQSQQHLKKILKSKGPLQEAQKYERIKKSKLTEIKSKRQLIKTLKQQKIIKIKESIQCLEILLQLRKERKKSIQRGFAFGANKNGKIQVQRLLAILGRFVQNMDYLRNHKEKVVSVEKYGNHFGSFGHINENYKQTVSRETSAKKKLSSSNLSHVSTPKNSMIGNNTSSFTFTQKKQVERKNNNRLQTKRIGNLNFPSVNQFNHQRSTSNTLQQITSQYQNIISQLQHLSTLQSQYLSQKSSRLHQEYKIRAMEKAYLIGILGYAPDSEPNNNLEKQKNVIKFAMKKCLDFGQVVQDKGKEWAVLVQLIANIQQTIMNFQSQISSLNSQPQRKNSTIIALQSLISSTSTSTSTRQPQIRQLQQQIKSTQSQRGCLQRQQEQYAEEGDLQNFKRIGTSIEALSFHLKQLESRLAKEEEMENLGGRELFGRDNVAFWGEVGAILAKYQVQMYGLAKISARSAAEMIAKFNKRLGNL